MINRALRLTGIAVLAIVVAGGTAAATPIGSVGIVDLGGTTASPPNIATATLFDFGNLVTTADGTGFLTGLPNQFLGPATFDLTNPGVFMFGNGVLGDFTATSIIPISNVPGSRSFTVLGDFTPGTFGGVTGGPFGAELKVGFTQVIPGGPVSSSLTFVTPTVIPEPATLVLFGTGLGFVGQRLRKKR